MQVVGPVDVIAPRVPLVQVDAAEIDHPQQRGEVLDHGEVDDVAGCVLDGARIDPGRTRRGRALHEEELAAGPVGIALHHHRPIAQVRQERGSDVGVVLEEIALGQAELGPEDLAQVGELHLPPVDGEEDLLDVARDDDRGRGRESRARRRRATRRVMIARGRRGDPRGGLGRGGNVSAPGRPARSSLGGHQCTSRRGRGTSFGGRGPWRTAPSRAT